MAASASANANGRTISAMPRMWDGGVGDGNMDKAKERDLTNTKLAKNQLVRFVIYPLHKKRIDRLHRYC